MHNIICKFSSPVASNLIMPDKVHVVPDVGDYVLDFTGRCAFRVVYKVHADASIEDGTIIILNDLDRLPCTLC